MTDGKLRALDIRRDGSALVELLEAAFTDELASKGHDIRQEFKTVRRMIPLILFLGKFFGELRHVFDGFVWEEDHRIVGAVAVQKMGNDATRWIIGSVATHPDYRRRGIARQLVLRAVEHARVHGARCCVLDVRSDNEPAYQLYRSLGFQHYDSTTALKLENLPSVQARPAPEGYRLRPMQRSEWPARYELALRATPPQVQAFFPVSEVEYRVTRQGWLLTWLLLRLQRLDEHAWAIEQDGALLGTLRLLAKRAANPRHTLDLMLAPGPRDALAEPLLTLALEILEKYPRGLAMTSVRASDEELVSRLKQHGFAEIETLHRLGIKLVNDK